jgi:hypothetical protein
MHKAKARKEGETIWVSCWVSQGSELYPKDYRQVSLQVMNSNIFFPVLFFKVLTMHKNCRFRVYHVTF